MSIVDDMIPEVGSRILDLRATALVIQSVRAEMALNLQRVVPSIGRKPPFTYVLCQVLAKSCSVDVALLAEGHELACLAIAKHWVSGQGGSSVVVARRTPSSGTCLRPPFSMKAVKTEHAEDTMEHAS